MSSNEPFSVVICEECEKETATIWCEICRVCLCSECSEDLHKGRTHSKHKRIPIHEKTVDHVLCSRHKKTIEFYCAEDNGLLCQVCVNVEHSGHSIKSVDDCSQVTIDEIVKNILNVQKKLNNHLNCVKPYASMGPNIRTIITQTFTKLRNILNSKETELMQQIGAIEQQNESALIRHQKLLDDIRTSLNKLFNELQEMLTSRKPIVIMKNHKNFLETIKKIDADVTYIKIPRRLRMAPYPIQNLEKRLIELMTFPIVETGGLPQIPLNATWSQNATTIIDGLFNPCGISIDQDDGTVFVADWRNKRIISWNPITKKTNVVLSKLQGPTDVLIEKETNSMIIADYSRVLRCSLEDGNNQVETIVDKIICWGLNMDNEGSLYVTDIENHEVRKFPRGENTGVLVAGGNGKGNGNHQLNYPSFVALDDEGSLYVTDYENHRFMKWKKEAKEGILVASGNRAGSNRTQLSYPNGIVVDSNGSVYVAEARNNRVIRWRKGEKIGEVIVGGNERGEGMHQLKWPVGLSFDSQNNLYIADHKNNRVQRFSIK